MNARLEGVLTPEQIAEVMRLASLLATARVLRYRVNSNSLGAAEPKKAAVRVRDCEQNLRNYLESL